LTTNPHLRHKVRSGLRLSPPMMTRKIMRYAVTDRCLGRPEIVTG
jgi:hypothetical protein